MFEEVHGHVHYTYSDKSRSYNRLVKQHANFCDSVQVCASIVISHVAWNTLLVQQAILCWSRME